MTTKGFNDELMQAVERGVGKISDGYHTHVVNSEDLPGRLGIMQA